MDAEGFRHFSDPALSELNALWPESRKRRLPLAHRSADVFSDLNQWILKVLLVPRIPDRSLSAPRDVTNADPLFTKSEEWFYEEEWRMVDSLYEDESERTRVGLSYPYAFHPDAVREVVVGCRADAAFGARVRAVLAVPDYAHVDLLKACLHHREYRLTFHTLSRS
jgi:hypothetical protein